MHLLHIMKILIACEFSGTVRRAFRAKGHEAFSCDLLPSEDATPYHFQEDVIQLLKCSTGQWDALIGFPDCTFVCGSGLHWNKRRPDRATKTKKAIEFFRVLWEQPIERIALENPIGCLSTRVCKPTQIIQPYQFGHNASKATCLWLKGFKPLTPTRYIQPRIIIGTGAKRWGNQTDSGQNKLPPSADRWKERSRTYEGIAKAMAEQWGGAQ